MVACPAATVLAVSQLNASTVPSHFVVRNVFISMALESATDSPWMAHVDADQEERPVFWGFSQCRKLFSEKRRQNQADSQLKMSRKWMPVRQLYWFSETFWSKRAPGVSQALRRIRTAAL